MEKKGRETEKECEVYVYLFNTWPLTQDKN